MYKKDKQHNSRVSFTLSEAHLLFRSFPSHSKVPRNVGKHSIPSPVTLVIRPIDTVFAGFPALVRLLARLRVNYELGPPAFVFFFFFS